MYMEYKYSCWINSKNYKLAKSMNKKVETSSVEQGCQYKVRGTEFPPQRLQSGQLDGFWRFQTLVLQLILPYFFLH